MKPSSLRYLQVLYLFAGLARKADLSTCLRALVAEFNRSAAFGFSVELTVEEIDILRGGGRGGCPRPHRRSEARGHFAKSPGWRLWHRGCYTALQQPHASSILQCSGSTADPWLLSP